MQARSPPEELNRSRGSRGERRRERAKGESALAEWRNAHAELAALIDVGAMQRIARATERLAEG